MDTATARTHFYADQEQALMEQFLKEKYLIVPAENIDSLNAIREKIATVAAEAINVKLDKGQDLGEFLDHYHTKLSVDQLNDVRLKIITEMNSEPWFRQAYFNVARQSLATLVGNELAMQRRVNLSIQFPNDDSSLLPVHADVWSGDSPYEIVLWIPLVNCHNTKSMYIANAAFDQKLQSDFSEFKNKSSEDLFQHIKDDVTFLNVPFGSVLMFSQNVMHGNRINVENETRWSMNCRFKSILTPYHGKKMGEFFEPITLRPLTRLGLDYQLPGGLND